MEPERAPDHDDDCQEKKPKGASQKKKPRKKKTVGSSLEAGVGSSTGQMAQGGPAGEEDSEAGAPTHRVRDTARGNATQKKWHDYQGGAL